MSDATTAIATAPTPATPKKTKGKTSKKPRTKPSHPKTSDMVNAAIKNLKERGGSSLQAIKKYIASNYKVDAEKMAPFIRKYLKSAVTTGSLVQTKGKGASGSFKLSVSPTEKKVTQKPAKPKAPKVKKTKPVAAKPTDEKKPGVAAPKSPVKPKTAKSAPSKAKKTTKSPTKKPKAPKPKKVGAAKSSKKTASKKK